MAYRNIYLVRHGQYYMHQGENGALTPTGNTQAHAAAAVLAPIPFGRIYHSPILRAHQTADIIAQSLPEAEMYPSELLRECIPSIPPGLEMALRSVDPNLNGDTTRLCTERLEKAFNLFLVPPDGDEDMFEMLVCHGNVIRYLIARTMNAGADEWVKMIINNCGICRVMIDSSGERYLVSHNETGHLTFELQTHN